MLTVTEAGGAFARFLSVVETSALSFFRTDDVSLICHFFRFATEDLRTMTIGELPAEVREEVNLASPEPQYLVIRVAISEPWVVVAQGSPNRGPSDGDIFRRVGEVLTFDGTIEGDRYCTYFMNGRAVGTLDMSVPQTYVEYAPNHMGDVLEEGSIIDRTTGRCLLNIDQDFRLVSQVPPVADVLVAGFNLRVPDVWVPRGPTPLDNFYQSAVPTAWRPLSI